MTFGSKPNGPVGFMTGAAISYVLFYKKIAFNKYFIKNFYFDKEKNII